MQFGYQRLKVRFCRIMNITFTKDNPYEEVSLQNKTFLEIFRDNFFTHVFLKKWRTIYNWMLWSKMNNEKFTVASSRCRRNFKFGRF